MGDNAMDRPNPRCFGLGLLATLCAITLWLTTPRILTLTLELRDCRHINQIRHHSNASTDPQQQQQPSNGDMTYSESLTNHTPNQALPTIVTNHSIVIRPQEETVYIISENDTAIVADFPQDISDLSDLITLNECDHKRLVVVLCWLGIILLLTVWFILSCLLLFGCRKKPPVMRTEATQTYAHAQGPYDNAEDQRKQRCHSLRAQYVRYKSWRQHRRFASHPMLRELKQDNDFDKQILSYINAYVQKAWTLRPTDFTKYDENEAEYNMKIQRVYQINNPRLWDSFTGDKSSLDDIVKNLAAIKVPRIDTTDSFMSLHSGGAAEGVSLPSRQLSQNETADSTASPLDEEESIPDIDAEGEDIPLRTISKKKTNISQPQSLVQDTSRKSAEDNNQDITEESPLHHDLTAIQPGQSPPLASRQVTCLTSVTSQSGDVTESRAINNVSDEEEDEGLSVGSSWESLPLLARSWRASLSTLGGAPVSSPRALVENCIFLLHGTHIDNALSIIENGLELQRSGRQSSQFGRVLSVSESSWVADKYTSSERYPRYTTLTLLVMRTSLKHAYWRLYGEHVPPSIARNYDGLVSGRRKGYRQFRLFKEKCCYPEFLVVYDRVYPQWLFSIPWTQKAK